MASEVTKRGDASAEMALLSSSTSDSEEDDEQLRAIKASIDSIGQDTETYVSEVDQLVKSTLASTLSLLNAEEKKSNKPDPDPVQPLPRITAISYRDAFLNSLLEPHADIAAPLPNPNSSKRRTYARCGCGVFLLVIMIACLASLLHTPDARNDTHLPNTLGYYMNKLPMTFVAQIGIRSAEGFRAAGRVIVNGEDWSYEYDYPIPLPLDNTEVTVVARDSFDGIQRATAYYYKLPVNSTLYGPVLIERHEDRFAIPPWSTWASLPLLNGASSAFCDGTMLFSGIYDLRFSVCLHLNGQPSYLHSAEFSLDVFKISALDQSVPKITIPTRANPLLFANANITAIPLSLPATSRSRQNYDSYVWWFAEKQTTVSNYSWFDPDILETLVVSSVDSRWTVQPQPNTPAFLWSPWTVSQATDETPLAHGATCVFVHGPGNPGPSSFTTTATHFTFDDLVDRTSTEPVWATTGPYWGPQRQISSRSTRDRTVGPCKFYQGRTIWKSFGPERSGYYHHGNGGGADSTTGTVDFFPCTPNDLSAIDGPDYGCEDSWIINVDFLHRSYDNSDLVQEVCTLVNQRWREGNTTQPVAIFAHSWASLTLLEGVLRGVCNDSIRWFAIQPPTMGSSVSWLSSFLCSATGNLNTWPFVGFGDVLTQWTGPCSYQLNNVSPAPASYTSYPMKHYVPTIPTIQSHIKGVLCGRGSRGRGRSADFGWSTIFVILNQLGLARDLFASTHGCSSPAQCDRQFQTLSFPLSTGDGAVTLDSCQLGFETEQWSTCHAAPFYIANINHIDGTGRAGDSVLNTEQMPAHWMMNRIRSLFEDTVELTDDACRPDWFVSK